MTELTFTKTFLSTLDSKPLKLQPDYILPPKDLEITSTYTLPRMPHPMRPPHNSSSSSPSSTSLQGTPSRLTLILKSNRNPVLELSLPDSDVGSTTVLGMKERVAKELGMEGNGEGVGKVKVLWEKKPVSDAKTVAEVVGEEGVKAALSSPGKKVEFGVMVIGYKAPAAAGTAAGAEAEGAKMDVDGGAVDESFWEDLKGFLQQRLKDEAVAEGMLGTFKTAWEKR